MLDSRRLLQFSRIFLYFSAIIIALSFTGCKNPETPPPTSTAEYPENIKNILQKRSCMGCHSAAERQGTLALDTWQNLFKGSAEHGAVVVPYNTDWSALLWHVNAYDGRKTNPLMPFKAGSTTVVDSANLLTQTEYQTLRDWVAQGAPAANGTIAWKDKENTQSDKIFFLASGADVIGVVEPASRLVTRYATVGQAETQVEAPHYIQKSADGAALFVTLIEGGLVEKYDARNYQRLARSPFLGDMPAHVELSADGKWALVSHWIAGEGKANLTLLDAQTLTIKDQIRGAGLDKPHGIAWRKDGRFAYVTANGGNYIAVVEIDPLQGKFIDIRNRFSLEAGVPAQASAQINPYHLTFNLEENRLYVSGQTSNVVYALSVQDEKMSLLSEIGKTDGTTCRSGVGKGPRMVKYFEGKLFVACRDEVCPYGQDASFTGCISVLNVAGDNCNWIKNIYGIGHKPHGVAIDTRRRILWIFNENQGGEVHHAIPGETYTQGTFSVVSLNELKPVTYHHIEVPFFPTGCVYVE